MDDRLATLAAQSENEDVVLVEMVYRSKWVTFDMGAMELKYLSLSEIAERYLKPAFDALSVARESGETHAQALSSSSETNV
jgi:hypothetical protein